MVIEILLILTAICTSAQFFIILFFIFAARSFIKDVWKYWTQPIHVYVDE